MKNRLTITLSDTNSTKTYTVNKLIKKIVIYTILIISIIMVLSVWLVSYLNTQVNILQEEEKQLSTQNILFTKQIEEKIKEIDSLGDNIKDIEDIMGLSNDDNKSLKSRLDIAKLTSSQKLYMLQTIPNGNPLKEITITSKFGKRKHPMTNRTTFHKGVDLRAERETNVMATADGVVRYTQKNNKGNYGRMIIISHNFGFETVFAHLRYVDVSVGDVIRKGQVIARSGNSGRSSGPHLHYEVRYASRALNPKDFMDWTIKNYDKIFEKQRRVEWESLVEMIKNQNQKLELQ